MNKDDLNRYTALRFYINDEPIPISVPGKLLKKSKRKYILYLKKGDKVSFYELKKTRYFDTQRRTAYGLADQQGDFYTKDEALSFFQGTRFMVISIGFVAMGLVALYFLVKNWF